MITNYRNYILQNNRIKKQELYEYQINRIPFYMIQLLYKFK